MLKQLSRIRFSNGSRTLLRIAVAELCHGPFLPHPGVNRIWKIQHLKKENKVWWCLMHMSLFNSNKKKRNFLEFPSYFWPPKKIGVMFQTLQWWIQWHTKKKLDSSKNSRITRMASISLLISTYFKETTFFCANHFFYHSSILRSFLVMFWPWEEQQFLTQTIVCLSLEGFEYFGKPSLDPIYHLSGLAIPYEKANTCSIPFNNAQHLEPWKPPVRPAMVRNANTLEGRLCALLL